MWTRRYSCEAHGKMSPAAPPAAPPPVAPGGYVFVDTESKWDSAQAHCQNLGMHLAVVRNLQDHWRLMALVNSNRVWLGGADNTNHVPGASEGRWHWLTGEEFSTNPRTDSP